MNEIVQAVAAKTGISPEQAQKAVETVLEFVKGKLPAGLGGQLDGLLSGTGGGGLPDLGGLGAMFGGGEKK